MDPNRKEVIYGHTVEEFHWNGKMVVYVDHHAVEGDFETACAKIKDSPNDHPQA